MAHSSVRQPSHLVSIAQAAEHLGVTTKTVRRRIADGTIPAYRFGGRLLRVDLNELEAALRRIPVGGAA